MSWYLTLHSPVRSTRMRRVRHSIYQSGNTAASGMASNDVDDECCFMFTWAIENWPVSFLPSFAESPTFHADSLQNTKWRLQISSVEEEKLVYSIHRHTSTEWNTVEVIFEISFLDPDGSTVVSVKERKYFNLETYYEFVLEDAFGLDRTRFIVNDTLTIRCQLWNADDKYSSNYSSNRCFAHTRLAIERRTVFWCVRKFSDLSIDGFQAQYRLPHLSQKGHHVLTLNLKIIKSGDGESVLITILGYNVPQRLNVELSVLDTEGKKRFCKKSIMYALNRETSTFVNLIAKEELMKYKESMLYKDSLCIRCEFEIENGSAQNDPHDYIRKVFFL
ncbi:uncharacterized protein TNIN_132151 [Trichonephila inaurata madagascariensis]|uniref:MATH domain-containing protein n=1 Tax=Trichonephila inaurata madagascariensis TaxID=2747483 RepID=A0A8X7CP53_9ARAC|nr:uncharacterized protein TNIN_132151 [Trichonephila inaurata madagascariensis]